MYRKVWLWVSLLMNGVGGLANVLALIPNPFGLPLDSAGMELVRFVGIMQLGYAVLAWFGLKLTAAEGQRAVDLTLFVAYVLGIPYIIYETIANHGGVGGYLLAIPASILSIGFGYYAFGRRADAGQQPAKSSRAAGQ